MNLHVPREHLFKQPDGTWWFVVDGWHDPSLCNLAQVPSDRTLTIETECDCACHRLKSAYPGISHDVLGQCKRDGSCVDGTVSLGPFRIETPVPIVDPDTAGRDSSRPVVVIYGGRKYAYLEQRRTPQYGDTAIDLGSDPARFVGWYAVKAETA